MRKTDSTVLLALRAAALPALAFVIAVSVPTAARAGDDHGALPDYPYEAGMLVETPGVSNSALAGMFNPASWALMDDHRLFLGWDEIAGSERSNWTGALSLRNAGFAARRFSFGVDDGPKSSFTDYTIGIGGGTRSGAFGISYSWAKGDLDETPRHERVAIGHISRWRRVSFGVVETMDLENRDNSLQVDLGIRPLGPQLTIFGDAVYEHGQSFEDIRTGYGVEYRPVPGLALAAKAQSSGEFSFRFGVDISRQALTSFRPHFDDDADRTASTYSIEFGPERAPIGHGHLGVGKSYPVLNLKGGMTYRRYKYFDNRRTLLDTLNGIESMADNPRVGGVVINMSGMSMGAEMAWELREQLAGFRARGKKVIVYFDRVSIVGAMLASVADQVWMDPSGMVDISGLSMGRTYYKNMLEKAGLGIDEWRFFTYKSAFESFSRDSMSDPDREQRQALIDDFYDEGAEGITSSRGITRRQLDNLMNDKAMLLPDEALAAGLVDSIGTIHDAIAAAPGVAPRSTKDASYAHLAGLLGDSVWDPLEWGEPAHIALLYAIGPCAMDSGIKGRLLSQQIRKARENPAVKAVVLRVDSGGGDALPSDLVSRELKETQKKKPVIVSQGWVAGSGGYWISMYSDKIVASPLTITGSIGVIGGWVWNDGFGDKIGLTYDVVQHGDHADLGGGIRLPFIDQTVPERPLTKDERDRMESLIRTMYKDFVKKVAEGRGLTEDEVDAIGQGRVWSGTRGLENGLVDELGGLWLSLQLAKKAAGIPAGDRIYIAEGPDLGSFNLGDMFSPRLFGITEPDPVVQAQSLLPEAELNYLKHLIGAKGQPILMMEPFEIIDGLK
jgi:protease-4